MAALVKVGVLYPRLVNAARVVYKSLRAEDTPQLTAVEILDIGAVASGEIEGIQGKEKPKDWDQKWWSVAPIDDVPMLWIYQEIVAQRADQLEGNVHEMSSHLAYDPGAPVVLVKDLGVPDDSGRRDRHTGKMSTISPQRGMFVTGPTSQRRRKGQKDAIVYLVIGRSVGGLGEHRDTKVVRFAVNLFSWTKNRQKPPFNTWQQEDVCVLQQGEIRGTKVYFPAIDKTYNFPVTPHMAKLLRVEVETQMERLISQTLGAGLMGYVCKQGHQNELRSRLEKILTSEVPIYFADREGKGRTLRWGLGALRLSPGMASFIITTEKTIRSLSGKEVLAKDPTNDKRDAEAEGVDVSFVNMDDIIPWEQEPGDCHSPIGGVLQLMVRIFGIAHGVPNVRFDYGPIRTIIQKSRRGVIGVIQGTMMVTDVIVVQISAMK